MPNTSIIRILPPHITNTSNLSHHTQNTNMSQNTALLPTHDPRGTIERPDPEDLNPLWAGKSYGAVSGVIQGNTSPSFEKRLRHEKKRTQNLITSLDFCLWVTTFMTTLMQNWLKPDKSSFDSRAQDYRIIVQRNATQHETELTKRSLLTNKRRVFLSPTCERKCYIAYSDLESPSACNLLCGGSFQIHVTWLSIVGLLNV